MPAEYVDDEDRAPPYNAAIATEQGVNGGGGGYTVPVPAGQTLRGYKSTVVRLNGHGTAVSVEVGWKHSDDAANMVTLETKAQASALAGTLMFVNQGDILDHVKLTGGANIDYSVLESNQLPLAVSKAAPDTLRLFGVNLVIPATVGGFSGESPWSNANKITTGTNIWTYTLDGGGNVVEVLASAAGLYEMWFSGVFAAPSKLVNESLVANVFGTIPIADHVSNTVRNETTTRYGAAVGLLTSFATGTAQFSAEVDFDNNASGNFNGDEWWIKHWTI